MSKKKGKFDLTKLVHDGVVKEGETFFFVSDNKKSFTIQKQPNHEFKIKTAEGTTTVHAYAQACLGQEPPNHASCWFKNTNGKTLYDIWQDDIAEEESRAA
jgi:hypothetical protein